MVHEAKHDVDRLVETDAAATRHTLVQIASDPDCQMFPAHFKRNEKNRTEYDSGDNLGKVIVIVMV